MKGEQPVIVAVDFDGILCENRFPDIGKPKYDVISAVRHLIDCGCEVILWTSRVDDALTQAVDWCHDRGLHFCAVNENAPSNVEKFKAQYPNGTRKVYADYYIDDHNIEYVMSDYGESSMMNSIRKLVNKLEKENRK